MYVRNYVCINMQFFMNVKMDPRNAKIKYKITLAKVIINISIILVILSLYLLVSIVVILIFVISITQGLFYILFLLNIYST